ncbi:MAG: thioredoxin-disulfide reductase [Candidatus Woesebacteria bacterium]|nr:MAG: thioredoxin-disulfide reductase [Candidatus Woesebacteria bacterium]
MDKIWDVTIIGSGPSALTSAIYTTRGSLNTLIFGGENWGGQLMLTTTVDNFPGFPEGIMGPDLMGLMRRQAERFGASFIEKAVTKVDFSKKPFEIVSENKYLSRSVIIATGAQTLWLNAPGISNLIGRGVSSCAPCDAPFFKDKRVAVVGGGDSAMEEALVLTKFVKELTLIHRRDSFRASKTMQDKVLNDKKIKILWNTEVIEAEGDTKLEKLIIKNNRDNSQTELLVDGLFIAIGHKPDSDIFKDKIDMDEHGFIKVFDHTKTNIEGVFVAGDVHDNHYKQAITAAGFGCMAGMDTISYLDNMKNL